MGFKAHRERKQFKEHRGEKGTPPQQDSLRAGCFAQLSQTSTAKGKHAEPKETTFLLPPKEALSPSPSPAGHIAEPAWRTASQTDRRTDGWTDGLTGSLEHPQQQPLSSASPRKEGWCRQHPLKAAGNAWQLPSGPGALPSGSPFLTPGWCSGVRSAHPGSRVLPHGRGKLPHPKSQQLPPRAPGSPL